MTYPNIKTAWTLVCVHLKGLDTNCFLSLQNSVLCKFQKREQKNKQLYHLSTEFNGSVAWSLCSEGGYAGSASRFHHSNYNGTQRLQEQRSRLFGQSDLDSNPNCHSLVV